MFDEIYGDDGCETRPCKMLRDYINKHSVAALHSNHRRQVVIAGAIIKNSKLAVPLVKLLLCRDPLCLYAHQHRALVTGI